ncbi:MAG: hypothetical protein C0597_11825, partial [Marinilabiliales bacterium]
MNLIMISNLALIITSVYLYSLILRYLHKKNNFQKIATGILFGTISVLSMIFAIKTESGVIFDGRSIILGLVGIFGGGIATLIAAIISMIYRIIIGGSGMITGIIVIVTSAFTGYVFCIYFPRIKLKRKYYAIFTFGVLLHIIVLFLFFILLPMKLNEVSDYFWIFYLVVFPVILTIIYYMIVDQKKKFDQARDLELSRER